MVTKQVDSQQHPLADLYARWALNPLIEIAHVLSYDVVVRPQNYRRLSDETMHILRNFRFKTGVDPDWPNAFQRTLGFKILCQVQLASPPVRAAALLRDLAKRSEDVADFEAFLDAAETFRGQLKPLEGQGLLMVCEETRPIFEQAVRLFQSDDIAQAFGLPAAPVDGWPLSGASGGSAAYLVAQIVRGVREVACLGGFYKRLSAEMPEPRRFVPRFMIALPQSKFTKLQQAAHWGSLTIDALLADGRQPDRKTLAHARNWAKALQQLVPDSARAWTDLEYRARLTDLEWGMAPNPVGDPMPMTAGSLAAQTYTMGGEICCCSGDLDCDPTSQLTDFCSEFQCPGGGTFAVAGRGCV